jgi:hypothetical protein
MTRTAPHPDLAMLGEGPWWIAHEHPARPADPHCVWSWACDGCMEHLIRSVLAKPQGNSKLYLEDGVGDGDITATLREARRWRARNGWHPI